MRTLARVAVIMTGLVMAACSSEEISESMIPDNVRGKLNSINDAIVNRNDDVIRRLVPDSMSDKEFDAGLEKIFNSLPRGAYVDRELVGFKKTWLKTTSGIDRTTYQAGYQFHYTGGWLYVRLQMYVENEEVVLQKLNTTPINDSLQNINAFTFSGKPLINYMMFALAVLIPLFIVTTFIACFRMRNLKRRKRWLVFVLLGIGGITLNWTTGALVTKFLSVRLLGAGFWMSSTIAPVALSVGLPLGAILFWVFRQTGRLALVSEEPSKDEGLD